MTTTARYSTSMRVLLDHDLAQFARDEAKRERTNVSAVLRQALAARRDRYLAAEREKFRHAAELHRRIEEEHEKTTRGY